MISRLRVALFSEFHVTLIRRTTIVTFLMVFLIQNTQNRDAVAIQLKLDELLRAVQGARTSLVDLEELDDKEILRLKKEFERIHQHADMGEQFVEEGLEESTATRNGVGGNGSSPGALVRTWAVIDAGERHLARARALSSLYRVE